MVIADNFLKKKQIVRQLYWLTDLSLIEIAYSITDRQTWVELSLAQFCLLVTQRSQSWTERRLTFSRFGLHLLLSVATGSIDSSSVTPPPSPFTKTCSNYFNQHWTLPQSSDSRLPVWFDTQMRATQAPAAAPAYWSRVLWGFGHPRSGRLPLAAETPGDSSAGPEGRRVQTAPLFSLASGRGGPLHTGWRPSVWSWSSD